MRCLYINLDHATARRASLEASFRQHAPPAWTLIRIAASGPADVADIPGAITPGEKACWLSHKRALAETIGDDAPVLIVEDDVLFSQRAFFLLAAMAESDAEWDLLFTDVTLVDANAMVKFAREYAALARAGNFRLHDVNTIGYAGAPGYVVRGPAKRRLLDALDAVGAWDLPYDIVLRNLAREGRLVSRVCLPYLTTPSPEADESLIQPQGVKLREHMVNAFRMLMFADRDLDACRRYIDRLEAAHGDAAAIEVGRVFAILASEALQPPAAK